MKGAFPAPFMRVVDVGPSIDVQRLRDPRTWRVILSLPSRKEDTWTPRA